MRMSGIEFKNTNVFTVDGLRDLFMAVEWESGKYPHKLQLALENSHRVVSAWEGNKLVGLINALSDGTMTAYFHYKVVHPEYQDRGIGKKLMQLMLEEYEGYDTKVLISYSNTVSFYQKCSFDIEDGTVPLFITELV